MSFGPERALLTDRVAVVTGAAQGSGRAIALAYARFGADLALCDRDADHLNEVAAEAGTHGRRVLTGVLDVRDGDAVRDFAHHVWRDLGRIEILVNNAGG